MNVSVYHRLIIAKAKHGYGRMDVCVCMCVFVFVCPRLRDSFIEMNILVFSDAGANFGVHGWQLCL